MSETLITVLEDVLFLEDVRLDRHHQLYKGLATNFKTIVLSTWERGRAIRVLKTNRLTFDLLLTKDASILTDTSWKVAMVREVMGWGWPIGLYLDVDPQAVREVFALGGTTLLLSHRMLRPSWLPSEGPPRAWEDLVSFQEAQLDRSAGLVEESAGRWGRGEERAPIEMSEEPDHGH